MLWLCIAIHLTVAVSIEGTTNLLMFVTPIHLATTVVKTIASKESIVVQ